MSSAGGGAGAGAGAGASASSSSNSSSIGRRSARTQRSLKKLHATVAGGDFYKALQMYQTLANRYRLLAN